MLQILWICWIPWISVPFTEKDFYCKIHVFKLNIHKEKVLWKKLSTISYTVTHRSADWMVMWSIRRSNMSDMTCVPWLWCGLNALFSRGFRCTDLNLKFISCNRSSLLIWTYYHHSVTALLGNRKSTFMNLCTKYEHENKTLTSFAPSLLDIMVVDFKPLSLVVEPRQTIFCISSNGNHAK